MPNKYPIKKGWDVPKQKYKVTNWPEYNAVLKRLGDITVWLSEDAISNSYEKDCVYDGTGTPQYYTDFAIMTCHEIRQIYKLPLRQTEGFINSLFSLLDIPLTCSSYSTLSTRLSELNIRCPLFKKHERPDDRIHAIAIDSPALKRFGLGEWHEKKYPLSNRASWRKLHLAVNEEHYIEGCTLTDRFCHDDQQIKPLLEQIDTGIKHFSGDGAYNEKPVYDAVILHSPGVDVVIPSRANAVINDNSSPMRNRNIEELKTNGRMAWQRNREYGRRNISELAVQRYQRILGDSMYSSVMGRKKNETMIGCGVINKMTALGMPASYKTA